MSQLTFEPAVRKRMPLDELLDLSWQARQSSRPRVFEVVYPAGTLPVSVTGTECSLQCAHCGGRYLEHMATVDSIDHVLSKKNITGILLSGGCDQAGQVPLVPSIGCVRRKLAETGRPFGINVHPGIVGEQEALEIADFATVISFDFVLDDVTIQAAFGGYRTGRDYIRSFSNLRKGKAKVVPHILVGLYKGEIRGEYEAVEFLAREGVDELIFIVFIPTPRTRWEHLPPPDVDEVLRLIAWARVQNPQAKISLGCMRPKGKYREQLDPAAVKAGVDAMVLPHSQAVREARDRGLAISRKEECCAFD
ncbi:MAG TPA: radical SAM protein [Firmicutes bacterium]|nr:radical SAM protein [Candidatus Fermentithermobacillaceae bacterium]